MGQILSLEDFTQAQAASQAEAAGYDLKPIESAAFDKGYKAGWDDSTKESDNQDRQARANCATALQAIDFTYFEARQHVMASFNPLLEAMLSTILPEAAQHAVIPLVQQELHKLAKTIDTPIEILCAPETLVHMEGFVKESSKGPVSVTSEETLSASQVQLRFSDGMSEIDMNQAITAIKDALADFFASHEQEPRKYG